MTAMRFEEIRDRLLDDIEGVCAQLVPDGRRKGKYWIGRNPTRDDVHAGSFWVLLTGSARGAWRDEAGIRGVDEGDIVRLVQYCRRLPDMAETRRECLKLLGMAEVGGKAKPLSAAELEKRRQARAERMAREAEAEAIRREKNAGGAFALWLKAEKLTPATFPGSIVDRYWRSRGLDLVRDWLDKGRHLPGAVRLLPTHDYHTSDGEVIEGLPCMIALATGPDARPRAVHRTWLRPDGGDKAALPGDNKPRKIWPAGWQGAVVRIAKGAGNLTPEEAGRQGRTGPLILAEGIEDALTLSLALPDYRVWAALTLGNLRHVPILPCVGSVIVAADNDWGKPQAMAELEAALAALRASGRTVSVARSPRGKDFNDLIKGD
jgi:hypothetical protein